MIFPLNQYTDYKIDITIENLQGQQIYQATFSDPKNFDEFIGNYCKSRSNWGIAKSMLIPIRTNKEFYKDLFFPTVVNRALTVDGIVKKSFALILAFPLDMLTFPARAIAFIPRAIYNAFQKDHPLYDFLVRQQGISEQLLGHGILNLKCEEEVSLVDNRSIEELENIFDYSKTSPHPRENRNKMDQMHDFYFCKYFVIPNIDRKPLSTNQHLKDGNEKTKIIRKETMQREIKWKVLPHGSCHLQCAIKTSLYHKNELENWEIYKEIPYNIDTAYYEI